MPQLTRGPLPAGVYWRRRLFVLALAGTLVFVIASLLSGGSDGRDDDVPVAQQVGQVQPSQTVTVSEQPQGRKAKRQRQQQAPEQGPTYDPGVLVEPEGNCDPADVKVTPEVSGGELGRPVTIGLQLQTLEAEACYFRVGSDKVTVRINDGSTEVWTSRECPAAVPDESVAVRRVVATVVEMTWDARESDTDCSTRREWLRRPGDFTIAAAALGGEPSETTFELTRPAPETVTVAPDPEQDRDDRRGDRGDRGDRDSRDDRNEWRSEDAQGAGGDDQPTR
jgi:hypothetical protein